MLMKLITGFILLKDVMSQGLMIPGSQVDEHNCVLDGGYSWCDATQKCQRLWEEPCLDYVDFCQTSNVQMCRMACAEPECEQGQCAMRIGNCCDYTCVNSEIDLNVEKCSECLQYPCPMPAIQSNCNVIQPVVDHCGCSSGCPTVDCSSHQLSVGEGESCGGFMMRPQVCNDGLECVNTMGPMIADAPGTCQRTCRNVRDSWGNCVTNGCSSWFDGCNNCNIINNDITCETDNLCYTNNGNARCLDSGVNTIPRNCLTWYDGCNSCSVLDGEIQACTLMMCFTQNEPYCQTFTTDKLHIGDICYRFCEDNSQNMIDRRNDCPSNSECGTESEIISFDNCGNRALRCVSIGH